MTVSWNAELSQDCYIYENAEISDEAEIGGTVAIGGSVIIKGETQLFFLMSIQFSELTNSIKAIYCI